MLAGPAPVRRGSSRRAAAASRLAIAAPAARRRDEARCRRRPRASVAAVRARRRARPRRRRRARAPRARTATPSAPPARACAGPCSSWPGRPRPRWPRATAAPARSRPCRGPRRECSARPRIIGRHGIAGTPPLEAPASPAAPARPRALRPRAPRLGGEHGAARAPGLAALQRRARRRPRRLHAGGAVARHLLPRRQDRLLRRPDDAHRERLRDARGRPAADDAARLVDAGAPEQPRRGRLPPSSCAASRFALDPGTGPTEIAGTVDGHARCSSRSARPPASAARRASWRSRPLWR